MSLETLRQMGEYDVECEAKGEKMGEGKHIKLAERIVRAILEDGRAGFRSDHSANEGATVAVVARVLADSGFSDLITALRAALSDVVAARSLGKPDPSWVKDAVNAVAKAQ